jgi:membrane protein required for colicin V production
LQTADIVVLVTLIIPGLIGALYGFLNIVFSIIAWILAFGISFKFGALITPLLAPYIETPLIKNILAFSGLFLISLALFSLVGFFLVKLLGRAGLTAVDRVLGFFLGIGLGGFIITVAVFMAGFTAFPEEGWWKDSVTIKPFEHIALWSHRFLPANIVEYHGYGATETTVSEQQVNS